MFLLCSQSFCSLHHTMYSRLKRLTPRSHGFRLLLALMFVSFYPDYCVGVESVPGDDLEHILAEEGLTGIAWSLVHGADEVAIGATGVQDNATGVAFASDARFHVGSLTKTLLATGVLRLVTEQRIELDAPVLAFLPALFPDKAPAGFSDITVRHLLDHTAGLNDAHLWQIFSERAAPEGPLSAAFPDPASQLRLRSRPGSRFSYSNMGFALLGMIVEAVVGERYETYLNEHLLAPLGMHNSSFGFTVQEGEYADPGLAWGHIDDGSRYAARPMFLRPSGQFTTTATDLARFAQFLLGDGVLDGQTFIDSSLMKSRGRPIRTEAADEGLLAGYALGLARRDRHGVVGYCHGGNVLGFVARLCLFPDENKAFAYSVNTDSETANYGRFDRAFIHRLGIAEATQPPAATPPADISEWTGRYVLSPNRFSSFEYLDIIFGVIRIHENPNHSDLVLSSIQGNDRQLRPVGHHLYSADDRATASHVFLRGTDREYLLSDGFQTFEKVATFYLIAHWVCFLLGLAGLVWILTVGTFSLLRFRSGLFRRAEAPAYFSSLLLFVPVPLFLTQSIFALGDVTLASLALALVTLMLPLGMVLSIIRAGKIWKTARMPLVNGLAAVMVLQWCAVLFVNGMLPFRLWS